MFKALSVLFGTAAVGATLTIGIFLFGEEQGVSDPNYVACVIILATVTIVFIEGVFLIYDEIKDEKAVTKKKARVPPVADNTSEWAWTGLKTNTPRSATVSQIKPAALKKSPKTLPSDEHGFTKFEFDIAA